jgi:hypothetical protein
MTAKRFLSMNLWKSAVIAVEKLWADNESRRESRALRRDAELEAARATRMRESRPARRGADRNVGPSIRAAARSSPATDARRSPSPSSEKF